MQLQECHNKGNSSNISHKSIVDKKLRGTSILLLSQLKQYKDLVTPLYLIFDLQNDYDNI